jgi:hypothetical protein
MRLHLVDLISNVNLTATFVIMDRFIPFQEQTNPPASSTTKTGCHDIAEILLKVALKYQK